MTDSRKELKQIEEKNNANFVEDWSLWEDENTHSFLKIMLDDYAIANPKLNFNLQNKHTGSQVEPYLVISLKGTERPPHVMQTAELKIVLPVELEKIAETIQRLGQTTQATRSWLENLKGLCRETIFTPILLQDINGNYELRLRTPVINGETIEFMSNVIRAQASGVRAQDHYAVSELNTFLKTYIEDVYHIDNPEFNKGFFEIGQKFGLIDEAATKSYLVRKLMTHQYYFQWMGHDFKPFEEQARLLLNKNFMSLIEQNRQLAEVVKYLTKADCVYLQKVLDTNTPEELFSRTYSLGRLRKTGDTTTDSELFIISYPNLAAMTIFVKKNFPESLLAEVDFIARKDDMERIKPEKSKILQYFVLRGWLNPTDLNHEAVKKFSTLLDVISHYNMIPRVNHITPESMAKMMESIVLLYQEHFIKEPNIFLFKIMMADSKDQTTLTADRMNKFSELLRECRKSDLNFIDADKFLFQWITDANVRNDFFMATRFNALPKGLMSAIQQNISETFIFSLTEECLQMSDKQIAFCKKYGLKTEKERIFQHIAICQLEKMMVIPKSKDADKLEGDDGGWDSLEFQENLPSNSTSVVESKSDREESAAILEKTEAFMSKHPYEPFKVLMDASPFLKLAMTCDDASMVKKMVQLKETIEIFRDQQITAFSNKKAYDPRMTTNLTHVNKSDDAATFENILHLVTTIQADMKKKNFINTG